MQKSRVSYVISLSLVFILALSIGVSAAGESTGGASTSSTGASEDSRAAERQNQSNSASPQAQCELLSTRYLRIKCRIEQKGIDFESLNITEESCRIVRNQSHCALLYAQVNSCYDFNGRQKDQCFKRTAGFIKNNVREEKNPSALREYAVFVLYNLQEKVEEAYEEGAITSDDAALLIDQIVIVKQVILNDGNKAQVKPSFDELKRLWQEKMQ